MSFEPKIKVWDPVVRIFHWSLVGAFLVAYLTEPEDSGLALHVWAGYCVGGLILLRIVWGFVGTPHARFIDFAFGPLRGLHYLADLVRGRSPRFIGHSPAGAWMIYLLLIALGATVYTGMSVLASEKQQGPLARFQSPAAQMAQADAGQGRNAAQDATRSESDEKKATAEARGIEGTPAARRALDGEDGEGEEGVAQELHELLGNAVLLLAVFHIIGVLAGSVAHRENLVRAMITGYKRAT